MFTYILDKFFRAFPALRHRNYRYYFVGQLVSLVGTWAQMVSLAWLVLEMTGSAFSVGLVSALTMLPVLLFSVFGGIIVDRFDKKKILIFTQISLMFLAFVLGILTIFKYINITQIYILAFLAGTINAIDSPARQSFIIELVGREAMSSAIALNSGSFNIARVLGPAIAGFIIALLGTGLAFILNAVTFFAVIIALLIIKVYYQKKENHQRPIQAIREGIRYSFSHPAIKVLLIFTAIISIFGWSFSSILPYIIADTFHMGAESLGYFYAAVGIGAVLGAIVVSAFSRKINPLVFIIGGSLLLAVSLIAFSFTSSIYTAFPFLFLTGLGISTQFSTLNSTIQHIVTDNFRGRVMSLYTLAFIGMLPIGSIQMGFLAEKVGSGFAIRLSSVAIILFIFYIYFNKNSIQHEYERVRNST